MMQFHNFFHDFFFKNKAVKILFGPLAPKWASVNKIGPEVSMGTDVRISRLSINEKRSWELHVNVYKNFELIYFIFPYPHFWTKVPLVLLFQSHRIFWFWQLLDSSNTKCMAKAQIQRYGVAVQTLVATSIQINPLAQLWFEL